MSSHAHHTSRSVGRRQCIRHRPWTAHCTRRGRCVAEPPRGTCRAVCAAWCGQGICDPAALAPCARHRRCCAVASDGARCAAGCACQSTLIIIHRPRSTRAARHRLQLRLIISPARSIVERPAPRHRFRLIIHRPRLARTVVSACRQLKCRRCIGDPSCGTECTWHGRSVAVPPSRTSCTCSSSCIGQSAGHPTSLTDCT